MDKRLGSSICNKLTPAGAKFSVDFFRCGKCLIEYESLEDFVCHKITVDKCSLVLWESKKLIGIGLQIPSFIEFSDEESSIAGNSLAGEHNDCRLSKTHVNKKKRGRPRKSEDKVIIKKIEDLSASKSVPWKCCLCRLTFRSLTSLKFHRDSEHKHTKAVSKTRRACELENLRQLEKDKTSTNIGNRLGITDYITAHSITEDELHKESTCPKCGNKYKDPIVLKTHLNTVHCDSRPYKCNYDCSLSFKTKGSLMRHVRRHTGERPYVCKKCGRSFRESGALTRHLKSRFPCSTKTDNDLARYGKTVGLDKCESAKDESDITLPKSFSAIKAIITDVSKKLPSLNDQLGHSSLPSIDCDLIVNDVEEENNENHEQRLESSLAKIDQAINVCSKFGNTKASLNINTSENGTSLNLPRSKNVCNSENRETMLEVFQESSSKLTEDLLIEDEDLKCLACMQHFLNKLDFKSHLLLHLEGLPFRCIQCCYVCRSKQEIVSHQRKRHGVITDDSLEKNTEECENSLPQNTSELEEEDQNIQNIVKLLFRTQNSIEADELEFSGLIKKPAKHSSRCHICLKRFSGSLYLGCHMGTHTGEKPFVCDVCKKSFFLKDSLKKHTVCHSEERRYRCGECYKPFKRLSHVRDHLRIHSQLCPYQCTKCGKAFRWQGTLKSHELSHGGPSLRLHLCSTCGRRFPSKWSLARHQRLHSSETASAALHLTFQSAPDSSYHEERSNKTLDCLSETKIVCISDNELVLRKEDAISIEDQDSSVSGAGAETYVLITQEDGSSCLVPTVAIVEELQEGTAAVNNIEGGCS